MYQFHMTIFQHCFFSMQSCSQEALMIPAGIVPAATCVHLVERCNTPAYVPMVYCLQTMAIIVLVSI